MDLKSLMVSNAYENGGWVKDLPGLPGVELKVRNIGSSTFKDAQNKAMDGIPRSAKARGLSHAETQKITERCLREAVLIDWRGITQDGQPLAFSQESAKLLMTSPVFRDAVAFAGGIVGMPGEEPEEGAAPKDQPTPAAIAAPAAAPAAPAPAASA